ncbi:MAG: N-acetylglucosamine-6-phosphate deacetylase [Lentisphaerae bacterium]|nr:N-acetylglucosamine-6-phosphate deacetylase [Lentisphaerota bacterium]
MIPKKRTRRLYITGYCLTPQQRIDHSAVLCEDQQILAVGGTSAFNMDAELEVYDLPDSYIMPGFIDTHIHGGGGFDASRADCQESSIQNMSRLLASRGITGFVPTVVSLNHDDMLRRLACLADVIDLPMPGAEPVGIHLEGPFINPMKRGAQNSTAIAPIDLGFARELIAAGKGKIRRVTFAPELPNSDKLVELLCQSSIQPSMGHSVANESETLRAIDAGARCCTHLFNGMPPLEQRQISITAVALTDDRVTTELIIDGRHLHPRMIELACRCKPNTKLVAISDATMASGMPDGSYYIGDSPIVVENGFSHTADGKLAGTTTLLDNGWHSLMNYANTDETYAAGSVSYNPALSMNLHDRGILRPGTRADIAIFEQGSNRLLMTICRGEIVYRAEGIKPARTPESNLEQA